MSRFSVIFFKVSSRHRYCLNATGDEIHRHGAGVLGIIVWFLSADGEQERLAHEFLLLATEVFCVNDTVILISTVITLSAGHVQMMLFRRADYHGPSDCLIAGVSCHTIVVGASHEEDFIIYQNSKYSVKIYSGFKITQVRAEKESCKDLITLPLDEVDPSIHVACTAHGLPVKGDGWKSNGKALKVALLE